MRLRREFFKKYTWCFLLIAVVFLALVLRVVGCDWGQTSTFQGDEGKLVGPVQSMTLTGTYLHTDWRYPGQVTSKLMALILHAIDCQSFFYTVDWYVFCRVFTALVSTGTVVLLFFVARKVRGTSFALLVAFLAAVNPVFIRYAKQVTGDSAVFLFEVCVLWFSIRYLEKKKGGLCLMAVFAACATMEKWSGALICGYLAFIVIISCWKQIGRLCLHTLIALGVYFGTVLLLAPNILSDLSALKEGLKYSYVYDGSREYPPLTEYPRAFLSYAGIAATLFLLLGVYAVIRDHNRYHLVYAGGAICMGLQWLLMTRTFAERWGLLIYGLLIFLIAEGFRFVWIKAGRFRWTGAVGAVIVCACYISETMYVEALACCSNDTRLLGESFLEAQGATLENTVCDYYTTFYPGGTRNAGVTPAENRYIDDLIYYDETPCIKRPDIRFALIRTHEEGRGHEVIRQYGTKLAEFQSDKEGIDLLFCTAGHGAWYKIDLDAMRAAIIDAKEIWEGAVTGSSFEVYDIRDFTYEAE